MAIFRGRVILRFIRNPLKIGLTALVSLAIFYLVSFHFGITADKKQHDLAIPDSVQADHVIKKYANVQPPKHKEPSFHKIVHLDLKGAPPKVSYYRELFPLLKSLGATGLLLEYEDMYPYTDTIKVLAADKAYKPSEIAEIQKIAYANGLKVIPLIQSFGHFEFVLKHKQFEHLREVPDSPKGCQAGHPEVMKIVQSMIDQQVALHGNISHIHIGGDEVYTLGKSKLSQELMKKENLRREDLYLYHMMPIMKYIKDKYPSLKPIIWHDMVKNIDKKTLQISGIGSLVEPMVWRYERQLDRHLPRIMWEKFEGIFHKIWTASAFKGATGLDQYIVNIDHHRENHVSWLKLIEQWKGKFDIQGIVLTGWQRYDHFYPLCELLPVGIPSLAVCLAMIKHQKYDNDVLLEASELLDCKGILELTPDSKATSYTHCNFPGSNIYHAIRELHRAKRFVSPRNKKPADKSAQEIFSSLASVMPGMLEHIYYENDIPEWMKLNVYEHQIA